MDTPESKRLTLLAKIIDVRTLDPADTRRRRLLNVMLLVIAIVASLMLITVLVTVPMGVAGRPQEVMALLLATVFTLLGAGVLYGINRFVSGRLAGVAFVLLLIALAAVADEPRQVVDGRGLAMFALPILAASVLLQPWMTFVVAALSSLVIAVIGRVVVGQAMPNLPGMFVLVVLALVAYLSSSHLQRALGTLHAANMALQESERKYRDLFENVPISLWEEDFSAVKAHLDELRERGVGDLKSYFERHPDTVAHCATLVRIIDVNRSTLALYGAGSRNHILAGLNQFLGEEARDVFREQLIALATGRTRFDAEMTNRTLAGNSIYVSLSLSIAPGHEDTWSKVLLSITDITERKEAEEGQRTALAEALQATRALQESQRTLATLMANLPGIAYRCRNDRHRTMEFISEGCFALTGYQPADLLHNHRLSYAKLIHPDDREMVWDVIQAAVEAEDPFQLTYRIITASGEKKWVWEQGAAVCSSAGDVAREGFITDISERRQAEEALKEYTERLEEMVEERTSELRQSEEKSRAQYRGIPVPTYTWQKVGNDIVLVDYNDAAEAITQGKIANFVGSRLVEMYHDTPEIRDEIVQCFAEQITIKREIPYRFQSTGESKYLAVKYAFVRPDLVLVHTEDITERVRAEGELRKHATELKRMVNLMAGREVRMAELKEVIRKLRAQLEEAGLEPVANDPLLEDSSQPGT
jgi:PAS domain S-box-containing protein